MVSVLKNTQIQLMPYLFHDKVAKTIYLKIVASFLGWAGIEFNITCQSNLYVFIKIRIQIAVMFHGKFWTVQEIIYKKPKDLWP